MRARGAAAGAARRAGADRVLVAAGLALVLVVGRLAGQGQWQAPILTMCAAALFVVYAKSDWVVIAGSALLFAPSLLVGGVPGNEVGGAFIVLGGLVGQRRARPWPVGLLFLVAAMGLLITFFLVSGQLSGEDVRRYLHLLLWLLIILACAAGRASRRPVALGAGIGIGVSLVVSIASVPGSGVAYGERFVALVGDPNALATAVVVLGPLVFSELTGRATRVAFAVGAAALVLGTVSRTGVVAMIIGAGVYLLVPLVRGWALVGPATLSAVVAAVPRQAFLAGWFSERDGSDALRGRIANAGTRMAREGFWTGNGLGSTRIRLGGGEVFYFHNSYLAAVSEIGVFGLALALGLVLVGALRAAALPSGRAAVAGVAGGLVMASTLGEVLLDLPMAVAVGFAWGAGSRTHPPGTSARSRAARVRAAAFPGQGIAEVRAP